MYTKCNQVQEEREKLEKVLEELRRHCVIMSSKKGKLVSVFVRWVTPAAGSPTRYLLPMKTTNYPEWNLSGISTTPHNHLPLMTSTFMSLKSLFNASSHCQHASIFEFKDF